MNGGTGGPGGTGTGGSGTGGPATRRGMSTGVASLVDRLPDRFGDALRRWYRLVLMLLPTAARLPVVSVELRRWLPCWALRLMTVALALASAALVIAGPFGWLVVGALSFVILIRPGWPGAPILAVVLGFSLLGAPEQPWGARGPLLLLGLHACITLSVLLGATGWEARVQLRVLSAPARSFVVVQLIAQLTGALGTLLAGRDLSWQWIPVAAAISVLTLVMVWMPRITDREPAPPTRPARVVDAAARRWGDE